MTVDKFKLTHTKKLKYEKYFWERKYDGAFSYVNISATGEVTLTGKGVRAAEYNDIFPEVVETLTGLPEGDYKCEIAQFDDNGNDRFDLIQTRCGRKHNIAELAAEMPCTVVFFEGHGALSYDDIAGRNIIFAERAYTKWGKDDLYDRVMSEGYEGIVFKPDAPDMHPRQYKWKPEFTEDVWWDGDFVPGNGQHECLIGSVITHQHVGDKIVQITVGGFDVDMRRMLTRVKTFPLCMEVACTAYLKSGKLRHPRFKRLRYDKVPDDCRRNWEE